MKIWILNHYAVPLNLFPHARPHYFAKILHEKGHDVTIFAASSVHNADVNLINDNSPFVKKEDEGVHYVFLKTTNYVGNGMGRINNMIQYFTGVLSNAKKFERPDTILAMSVHPLACVAGILLAKRYKCSCVVDIADLWPESLVAFGIIKRKNPILKMLYFGEKWIYKKADAVIFSMEGGTQYIQDKGWDKRIDISKVYHINNGVDLEQFDFNKKNYVVEDKDLNENGIFKVIYTGSVRKAARLISLVKAAEQLQNENILFLIYGEGDERELLEQYCRDNNVSNIKFKGRVEKKYIPFILSKSNLNIINVQPTDIWIRYGSSENKLFEYLASAKPICANVKQNYSIIERYNCGIEENFLNEQDYEQAILQIKEMDEENYRTLCDNARVAAEKYDFHILTDKLEQILLRYTQS